MTYNMIMKKLLTKTDKIEIIALLPNMALLATFKYLGFTSLIWMAGTCIQLAFMAFRYFFMLKTTFKTHQNTVSEYIKTIQRYINTVSELY